MWWKMALRCQTRLGAVALHYASIYPGDCSVSRHPSKCSFDSQNWSLAAQNSLWGRSSCCWTMFASLMIAPGMLPVCKRSSKTKLNMEPRLKTGNFPAVMCLYPTDVLPPQWMFVHASLVKIAVQLMLWIWTDGHCEWKQQATGKAGQDKGSLHSSCFGCS